MKIERFSLALERLSPSDWDKFERLSSIFLSQEFTNVRHMASASGDKGRDAELFEITDDPSVMLQYSVTDDWEKKIGDTVKRLKENFKNVSVLIYLTNQTIGPKADDLKKEIRRTHKIAVDIRDRSWFLDRLSSGGAQEEAAENLAKEIVDPYLASVDVITNKTHALSSLEAQAAFVYLRLQWEDDSADKGLTKVSFEALVRAAVRNTDSGNKLSRGEIKRRVRSFLPSHDGAAVDLYADAALGRLEKRVIRHFPKEDEFCLTHEEQLKTKDRLTLLEKQDMSLKAEITAIVDKLTTRFSVNQLAIRADLTTRVKRVLDKFLLNRGESFAKAVTTGAYQSIGMEGLKDVCIADISKNPPQTAIKGEVLPLLEITLAQVVANPGAAVQSYLRSLADSYTLLAFLRETPDVQSAVVKMFSHGEIWLDTTVLLPVFAETLIDVEERQFTNLFAAARESGLKLRITDGVLEEVERHMNKCLAYHHSIDWKGHVPFLYSTYILSGHSKETFASWLENFRGQKRPTEDIAEYLSEELGIEVDNLTEDAATADSDLRAAVQEVWHEAHEKRRGATPETELDDISRLRLVEHDVENFLGVLGKRKGETHSSPFGYSHWWLTLDQTVNEIRSKIGSRLGKQAPPSPILSPDFLNYHLSFSPIRRNLKKKTEQNLPIVLESCINEVVPQELLDAAQKIRDEAGNLNDRIVRRRIRDRLDEIRMTSGEIAKKGLSGVVRDIQQSVKQTASSK